MKVAILLCMMAATALAEPRYKRASKLDPKLTEQVRAAEQAWTAAVRESDPAKQPALWEQAAAAFGDVDGASVDAKVKREAAYAAVLAWKNALALDVDPRVTAQETWLAKDEAETRRELTTREVKLIAAFDRYVKYVDPDDPELPGVLFLKARTYARSGQYETAIPIFRTIVDRHRKHEVGAYAANLLLDSYNRLRQYDQLVGFADELAKDTQMMRDNPDLGEVVRKIQSQAKRKQLERLEASARAGQDLDQHSAVGAAYLGLYNADPQAAGGDELLYNAGVAFETGRAIAAAIRAFELLQRQYPRSKLGARALARLGRIYASIAMYDKAAEKLEEYAKKYAGEKDAVDAMSDAAFYRKAIGDRARAIEDTKYFIKTFGMKRPREAADAQWSLTGVYEADPANALEHLREYLRRYAAKGDAARVVIAHAKIGQLLWKQSCLLSGVDGLCVKANERAARTCGKGTTRTLTVARRDPGKQKDALNEFAHAINEYERQPASDDPAARYYYAQAKLAAADAELEAYLALAFPRGLNFDPDNATTRTASMKRFSEWIEQKQKAGARPMRGYEAVLSTKDAASSITAAARIGIVTESFATALVTGEIPRDVRTGARAADKRKAHCDAMTTAAEPLEASAINAFAICLAKSTELAWFGESSAQCEHQLIRMKPDEFPRANELRIQPLLVAPVIASEPPPR